jgi:cob(I)alamin adenosyltransferase
MKCNDLRPQLGNRLRAKCRIRLVSPTEIITLMAVPATEVKLAEKNQDKGLTIVYTGNGKGKTTAALGMCVRAAGYRKKIKILQFVKGSWKYGELEGIKLLKDFVDMEQVGEGFVGIIDDNKAFEVHQKAAREGLEHARQVIFSGEYDIVVLDELNVAVDLGLVDADAVLALVKSKPEALHLVITGRNARPELIEIADLVTEMKEIKHPYQKGVLAQRAIDW